MNWQDIKNPKIREQARRDYEAQINRHGSTPPVAQESPGDAPKAKGKRQPKATRWASESELQAEVVAHLQSLGYKVAHFRPAWVHPKDGEPRMVTAVAADGKGWLDLHASLEGTGVVWVIECKMEGNDLTPEQVAWMRVWARNPNVKTAIVRPSSWDDIKLQL